MSLRLRVLGLIVLVTLTATAATAVLTWREASRQVERTVSAGQQEMIRISGEIARYGRDHGSWSGVGSLVAELARDSGQRVRLVNGSGVLLADSDLLAGLPERPSSGPPSLVDPRPVLPLDAGLDPRAAVKRAVTETSRYFHDFHERRCVPRPLADPQSCRQAGGQSEADFHRYVEELAPCAVHTGTRLRECLQDGFLRQIAPVAPEPLYVHIGTVDSRPPPLRPGPIALTAALVGLLAIAGALLLSRHVLRPIRAVTSAASRVGQGRLGDRVPVLGRDELAVLSREFNRMAHSLERSEERQRRMIADIAHELRTPLVNLRGYLEALTDGTAHPSPELFESLRDEAVLQQRIIDDLQDLALADAGALTYHRSRVDLAELAETCRAAHLAPGVTLVAVTDGPVHVDGDPDRLRQVLSNLLRNALQATGAGGSITVSVRRAGERAELSVADTGTGIREPDLPHVFDRFWRADSARSRATGGSGLGLAIVKQIVTDHGGTITVTSHPGRGAVFTVTLPAAR